MVGGVGEILENSTLSAQVNGKYISKKRWFGWVTAYNHSRAFFFSLKECFCATSAQNLGRQELDNMKVVNLSPWELRIWDFLDNQPWAEYSKFIDHSRRGWTSEWLCIFLLVVLQPSCWDAGRNERFPTCRMLWPCLSWCLRVQALMNCTSDPQPRKRGAFLGSHVSGFTLLGWVRGGDLGRTCWWAVSSMDLRMWSALPVRFLLWGIWFGPWGNNHTVRAKSEGLPSKEPWRRIWTNGTVIRSKSGIIKERKWKQERLEDTRKSRWVKNVSGHLKGRDLREKPKIPDA